MTEGTFKMTPGRLLLPPRTFCPKLPNAACPGTSGFIHTLMDVSQSPCLPSVGPFGYFCP